MKFRLYAALLGALGAVRLRRQRASGRRPHNIVVEGKEDTQAEFPRKVLRGKGNNETMHEGLAGEEKGLDARRNAQVVGGRIVASNFDFYQNFSKLSTGLDTYWSGVATDIAAAITPVATTLVTIYGCCGLVDDARVIQEPITMERAHHPACRDCWRCLEPGVLQRAHCKHAFEFAGCSRASWRAVIPMAT